MKVLEFINNKNKEFLVLCRKHNVDRLYVFGSSITGSLDEERSDIDLLVEIDTKDPIEKGENLLSLWDKFEDFFQRKIDLLTYASIKNPILRQNIDNTKVLIYDGKRPKVSV